MGMTGHTHSDNGEQFWLGIILSWILCIGLVVWWAYISDLPGKITLGSYTTNKCARCGAIHTFSNFDYKWQTNGGKELFDPAKHVTRADLESQKVMTKQYKDMYYKLAEKREEDGAVPKNIHSMIVGNLQRLHKEELEVARNEGKAIHIP